MTLTPFLVLVFVFFLAVFVILRMQPRRFYIVRHGETLLNASHIKQGAEGGLSESGKRQASKIGELFAPLHIHKIISSPYERARQTAELINAQLHVPIVYSPLLIERRNPSEVIGKHTRDPEVERIMDYIDNTYHEDDYRYSDEENFNDLKRRARECLSFLARQRTHTTCVVTHHAFLKMLLAYMLYREELHSSDFAKLSFFNMSDNGGISTCEFHPWKMFSKTRGWEIISYNEQP